MERSGRPALAFSAKWNKFYASWKAKEIAAKTDMKRPGVYRLVSMREEE